jgi:hypothetical protein
MIVWGLTLSVAGSVNAKEISQQPTVSIPTVTGTPEGPVIRVNADNDQINVRSGPGTDYETIGVMIAGQIAAAYGRSAGGSWIQVAYPGVEGAIGWVYSPLVTILRGSSLPILEPPPTATPRVTPTIDPTLASQFIIESAPTRLPTFTPPPELVIPTYESPVEDVLTVNLPMGLIIVIFGVIGILGALFSFIRGR